MRLFPLMFLVTAGCLGEDIPQAWPTGASYDVRTVGSPPDAGDWPSIVSDAVTAWSMALGPDCPFPFMLVPDPDPGRDSRLVRLWDESRWSRPGRIGVETHGGIEVRWNSNVDLLRRVTVHEWGHALGLEHSEDPLSIMHDVPGPGLTEDDVAAARALLGCP